MYKIGVSKICGFFITWDLYQGNMIFWFLPIDIMGHGSIGGCYVERKKVQMWAKEKSANTVTKRRGSAMSGYGYYEMTKGQNDYLTSKITKNR